MTTTTTHPPAADSTAASAIRSHHAELTDALRRAVDAVTTAASTGSREQVRRAVEPMLDWSQRELLPHARAEEGTLYRAAATQDEARLLVESMVLEHGVIGALVTELEAATTPVAAAAAARALLAVFETHVEKENDLVLPVLESAPDVSLAGLLDGMHDVLGGHDPAPEPPARTGRLLPPDAGCGCGCGHDAASETTASEDRS